jgi:hypothetical protein
VYLGLDYLNWHAQDGFMRFVFLLAALMWSVPALSQPANDMIQKRAQGQAQFPATPDGFKAERFAANLGGISALALGEDGALYVADDVKGRVYKLIDRDLDGRVDSTRVIASGLDGPSGLAVIGEDVYVSDQDAVWKLGARAEGRSVLASLKNIPNAIGPKPLLASADDNGLLLAINTANETGRIVSINIKSGEADLIARGPGPITAMAQRPGSALWIGVKNNLIPVTSSEYDQANGFALQAGVVIKGLVVPGQFPDMPETLSEYHESLIVAQGGGRRLTGSNATGMNVLAIKTQFGVPTETVSVLVDGFLSTSGRSGWGQPGNMVLDRRGMLLADSWSGTVWQVTHASPADVRIKDDVEPKELTEKPVSPTGPNGPRLEKGSLIEHASTIQTGSTIVEKWEKEQKEAESEAD